MSTPIEEGRRRSSLLGLAAVVVAAGTAAVAFTVVNRYQDELEQARAPDGTIEVVAAAHDLSPGLALEPGDLTLVKVSRDLVDREASYDSLSRVVGKVPGDKILAGEVVRMERLLDGGALIHADAAIDPGTRAVTVQLDRAASVGGLLEPGFFVDVIVTIRPDSKTLEANWVTATVLQGVRVIAVNEWLAGNPNEEKAEDEGRRRFVYVTLEVDPLEAERLALASSRGEIVLSLRHAEDQLLLAYEKPLVANALVGLSDPGDKIDRSRSRRSRVVRVEPPYAPASVSEVVTGTNVVREEFDAEGRKITKGK